MIRLAAAAATGLLLLVASPGSGSLDLLAFFALVPLFVVLFQVSPGKAAFCSWLAGFVNHAGLMIWVSHALSTYGHAPLPIAAAAHLGLAAYMALYPALFGAVVAILFQRGKNLALFFFPLYGPLLWIALETVRGRIFSGVPWMDLGYLLAFRPLAIQSADIFGHRGVSFLVVLGNCLVFLALPRTVCKNLAPRIRALVVATGIFVFCSFFLYGAVRLKQIQELTANAPRLPVVLLQGNIDQSVKWSPSMEKKTLDIYFALAGRAHAAFAAKTPLIVWPETALPFYPEEQGFAAFLSRKAAQPSSWILSGIPRFLRTAAVAGRDYGSLNNSAVLVTPAGDIMGWYAKQHLVPFGEYIPLKNLLPLPGPLVEAAGDFSPGRAMPPPLSCQEGRIGVLICFESIFPELAAGHAAGGANILVNLTNDAWYGRSSAPRQSLAMSVLRTVETRRGMARAANTGITAFIDPRGAVVASTDIFREEFLSGSVPLLQEKTFFVRWHEGVALVLTACALAGVAVVVAQMYWHFLSSKRRRGLS